MYVSFILFARAPLPRADPPEDAALASGITRGWVDEDWALQHHRKWVEEAREAQAATLDA